MKTKSYIIIVMTLSFAALILAQGVCLGVTYYVDPINGDISNDGSYDNPWSTLQEVFDNGLMRTVVQPGDTVLLRDGYHGEIVYSNQVNSDYITVAAQDGHTPKLKHIKLSSSSKWIFKGLTVSPEFAPVFETYTGLVEIWNSPDVIIEDNTIFSVQDASNWGIAEWDFLTGGLASHGILVVTDNLTIRNNRLKNVAHGIFCGGSNNVLIEHNKIEHLSGDGIQAGSSSNFIIQYNTFKNFYEVNVDQHDDGIQFHTPPTDNVTIRGNIILHREPNTTIFGDWGMQGIGCFNAPYINWLVENNVVIVPHGHGIAIHGATDSTIINNIAFHPTYALDKGSDGVRIHTGGIGVNTVIRNNMAHRFILDGTNITADHNIDIGDDYGPDALFADYLNNDLSHVATTSPAIDAGSPELAPDVDILGTSRPQGAGYDIGAYEYIKPSKIYYVATNDPNADDANPGTTEALPWKTLTKAANTAEAGDTVLVKAGTYYETLLPVNSGTAGNLITFKAYPGDNAVIDGEYIRPTVNIIGKDYIRVEGFEIRHAAETMHGVYLYNSYGIEIVNNNIHHNDVYTPNYWEGSSGIDIYETGGDVLIQGNDIHHNYYNGISPRILSLSNLSIINNDIHHNGNDGIQQGGGSNWLIEGNKIHDWGEQMAIAHPDGIQLFRSIDGLIIRNNIIWDQHQNIFLQPLTGEVMKDVEIYNNLIYRDDYEYEYQKGIFLHMQGGSMNNVEVYGNTVYRMYFGITFAEADPGALTGVEIRNNIIAEITGPGSLSLGEDINSPDINSDYNLFFQSNPDEGRIDWDGGRYYSLSAYQSATGQDLNSIGADPKFVNPSGFNFHLQPTSPAIDAGDPDLATVFTLPDPFLDLDGNQRYYGMGYDIGAYEYTLLPRVVISAKPNQGYPPLTVSFNISEVIIPNGEIVEWEWDFGDGATSQEKETSHTYPSPGEYAVTLTVTDIQGYKGQARTHIKVLEPEKEFQEISISCYNNVINPTKEQEALIWVELSKPARVKVDLYNTRGNRIRKLIDEEENAGTCKYSWNGKDDNGNIVGSGLYFVHIQAGDYKKTKKIVVVK